MSRGFVGRIAAGAGLGLAVAVMAGSAGAVPPPPGQVNMQGEALRGVDARPDLGPQDIAQRQEFDAASQIKDPAQRAAAFESFLDKHPDSPARRNALLQAAIAYEQAGNAPGLEGAARRIRTEFPDNVVALSVLVDAERRAVGRVVDPLAKQRLGKASVDDATVGLAALARWKRPDPMADEVYTRIRREAEASFELALGAAALREKDYANARAHLGKVVALRGDDWSALEQLAAADLLGHPVEPLGFWYAAKAITLARADHNDEAADKIARFASNAYRGYHGSDAGWDQIVAAAATQFSPPPGFAVIHQPSPAELAVQAVDQYGVRGMAFADWEAILSFRDVSPENRAAADKVWAHIQSLEKGGAASLKLPAKVIASSTTTLDLAVSDDSRASGVADIHAVLAQPLAEPLKPGQEIQVSGVLDDYTPQPFQFHMTRARVEGK